MYKGFFSQIYICDRGHAQKSVPGYRFFLVIFNTEPTTINKKYVQLYFFATFHYQHTIFLLFLKTTPAKKHNTRCLTKSFFEQNISLKNAHWFADPNCNKTILQFKTTLKFKSKWQNIFYHKINTQLEWTLLPIFRLYTH